MATDKYLKVSLVFLILLNIKINCFLIIPAYFLFCLKYFNYFGIIKRLSIVILIFFLTSFLTKKQFENIFVSKNNDFDFSSFFNFINLLGKNISSFKNHPFLFSNTFNIIFYIFLITKISNKDIFSVEKEIYFNKIYQEKDIDNKKITILQLYDNKMTKEELKIIIFIRYLVINHVLIVFFSSKINDELELFSFFIILLRIIEFKIRLENEDQFILDFFLYLNFFIKKIYHPSLYFLKIFWFLIDEILFEIIDTHFEKRVYTKTKYFLIFLSFLYNFLIFMNLDFFQDKNFLSYLHFFSVSFLKILIMKVYFFRSNYISDPMIFPKEIAKSIINS
jgi:hypothetical protein